MADPRAGNARYDLQELMFVALVAVLCGAEDCTDMAAFAEAKLEVLREVVKLEHGPPSHDTFSRVFRLLRPEPFEAAFAKFTIAFAGALKGVVAIDGKALRGAYERGRKATPLHLVNVWAAQTRLVIGQRLAPGRIEGRAAIVVASEGMDFPGLAAVARVETWRKIGSKPEPVIVRFYLLSTRLSGEQMLEVARTHWTIENQLHWVLDVAFDEDRGRSRKDNAPQNLALIRKLALNIIRHHPAKGAIKTKIKRAGWDNPFLLSMLAHMR